jgi:hypothetical protein
LFSGTPIFEAARAALAKLRLEIDALEEDSGDASESSLTGSEAPSQACYPLQDDTHHQGCRSTSSHVQEAEADHEQQDDSHNDAGRQQGNESSSPSSQRSNEKRQRLDETEDGDPAVTISQQEKRPRLSDRRFIC